MCPEKPCVQLLIHYLGESGSVLFEENLSFRLSGFESDVIWSMKS